MKALEMPARTMRADTTKTYYGEALAVVRAEEADRVKITVTDEMGEHGLEIPVYTDGKGGRDVENKEIYM